MWSQLPRTLVVVAASLALAACGGGGGGGGGGKSKTPASITIVAGNGQTAAAGTALPAALGVSVKDAAGRPVAGATVSWAVVAGGGSVTPASSTTDSAGLATTQWTLGAVAGTNRATATVAGLTPVAFDATAVAGTTASVTVTSPAGKIYEGDTVQLVATAKDAAGNVLPGRAATWISSRPDVAPVSPTGVLQTWGTGPVDVTASVDGVRGSVTLTLTPILATVTVGQKEIVFDWSVDRCEDLDVPDIPSRVIRAEDGSLVLFAGNAPHSYVSRGAGFNKFTRDCSRPVLVSADRRTPDSYENWEWIWAVYREGSTWHAFVHNEFHDAVAATCSPGDPSSANPCWYNSITHAVSTDGAHSFTKPLAPAHVVAPPPNVWTPPPAVPSPGEFYFHGYQGPSNIVKSPKDGYYYALISLSPTAGEVGHMCLMRTHSLDDPTSWRSWDGSGFNLRMSSPYVTGVPGPVCANLPTAIGDHTLSYNTYFDRYILVNPGVTMVDGEQACGYHYSLSADLIHWSEPRLLAKARTGDCPSTPQSGELETVSVGGPSLVDHDDTTVNFERSGRSPHVYYVRFNDGGLDRDLMRVQVTFTRTN